MGSRVGAPLVRLQGVSKTFSLRGGGTVSAVRDVSLETHPGELVCLFGPSGCGKTTLLNIIAGLESADAGVVEVVGKDFGHASWNDRAQHRLANIGVVFQDDNLVPEFTSLENVTLPLQAQGIPRREACVAADRVLGQVGLPDAGSRYPTTLSGGQQQRVGIARAIVGDRSLLLADEPTGALDTVTSMALFQLIRRLVDEGLGAIMVTHDLRAARFASTIHVMNDGCLTAPVSADELPELLMGTQFDGQ